MVEERQKAAERIARHGDGEAPIQFHVANRLFGQDGYPFAPDFLKTIELDDFHASYSFNLFDGL